MEEPGFGVRLTGVGDRRADVVRALRTVTGRSAWGSAGLLSALPAPAVEDTWFENARAAAERLREAGAEAEVVCGWCARVVPADGAPMERGPCASGFWRAADCRASAP
ncbi:hypothetical protein AB0N17_40000 [Streptomyces sp. NPDC051133]|uniref:hypothetical protein n=1 Tax=Streptomyces sp. NPDC051133 TaxID=3155521 RepID=UPI003435F7A0